MTDNEQLQQLLELANHYPSPHNGQPIEMQRDDDGRYSLFFDRDRGLQAAEVSYLFSYVAMGVFVQHLQFAADALGHELSYTLALPPLADMKARGLVRFASCQISFAQKPANQKLHDTLLQRQTSRKKYAEGLNDGLVQRLSALTDQQTGELHKLDRAGAQRAIWLNQRAVFDDMFDDAVRHELDHWLRYDSKQKEQTQDGLAYDCMELNGAVMKFIVHHHKLLRAPGISWLLEKYYLRTMQDNSDVFYLLAPFSTEREAFSIGITIMLQWEMIAAEGYYLHPFGTIMSNEAAHADFLKLAGVEHEDARENFLAFIFRSGTSEKPHSSLRIPIKNHLYRS
jgi:hypothetical protein